LHKFENDKRVVLIVTNDQYENLRLADLLFADVVITSYQFISSLHVNRSAVDVERLKREGAECLTDKNHLLSLHTFNWKRVILDEVHELGKITRSKSIITFISELRSEFKWNVTGTPFANGLLSYYLLMGLNTTLRGECLHMDERSNYISQSLPLFRRNTKESIQREFGGNIIREHFKFLTFTQQERAIYDGYELNSKAYNFLIQICCHTELFAETKDLIKNCKTFEEIQQVLVDWNKNLLDTYNEDIQRTERNIAAKVAQIEDFIREHGEGDDGGIDEEDLDSEEYYQDELTELKAQLGVLRKSLTMTKKHAENIGRTYNYLKYTMENLKENIQNECCPICLDEIEKDKLTITKCGHRFCLDCISKVTNDTGSMTRVKCPQCNQLITEKDIFVFKEEETTKEKDDEGEETLEKIIDRVKSTKVGNIIHFLKSIKEDDKVIVFSQWDDILSKVGQNLAKYNLKHVFCSGSVYQKKSAIKNFSTKSDVNIIMLSSKNAASRINLTEANKIVLIEPVYGSDQYRKSIEAQAIGRADRIGQKRPIDVYRFIIKDTVEEKIVQGTLNENN
jgi:SNF2 family DNA or RNA helicase